MVRVSESRSLPKPPLDSLFLVGTLLKRGGTVVADQLTSIWVPAGIMFAFQIEMVRWRIDRETKIEATEQRTWLPLCDYLNLLSMAATAFLVFVLPIARLGVDQGAQAFALAQFGIGLTAILLIGYLTALIGHYRLFLGGSGPRPHLPLQELAPVTITVGIAGLYIWSAWSTLKPIL